MTMDRGELPQTLSLCPDCLRILPARRIRVGEDVRLVKDCPEHGEFRSIIWRGAPDMSLWLDTRPPNRPTVTHTASDRGCPLDCGLCPEHWQRTCCVLLEVTARCNLHCPVCFAATDGPDAPDPSLDEIESWYRLLRESTGGCNIQLSGGEPTLRDDLPEIITMGREVGFSFFQLNTNGLRLASEPGYAAQLEQAGLRTVFLQFDGLDDQVYETLRGMKLLERKEQAVAACAEAGLGVVLVPTLVPDVNTAQVGRIIDYALEWLPHVRGVHFQPISYFGRYPRTPVDEDRYTLPELMRDIESQTAGRIPVESFQPSGCEHPLCSFSGDYLLMPDRSIRSLTGRGSSRSCCGADDGPAASARQRDFIARRWSPSAAASCCSRISTTDITASPSTAADTDDAIVSLDAFLSLALTHGFTITAMAFQDVWTVDLERLRNCCLHVVKPGGWMVPFCSYNLTDRAGRPLHRGTVPATAEVSFHPSSRRIDS